MSALVTPAIRHCVRVVLLAPTGSISAESNQMSFRIWPFGRCQRAARSLLDLGPTTTTRAIMHWAYGDRGLRRDRLHRARVARRACVSLGLIRVGRVWPGGNIWAYPKPEKPGK